ncbi:MAG: threonine synthase [Micavibrio aeruginosavorus]|uniref:Threonine synthase n=1 Tax=Micavibrio aeruginosavorus TaxID=349221 RepID=A0A7T5R2V9_9BACT|nr:MAG: threonine synthase [Micavibrio aeruginosavorus]
MIRYVSTRGPGAPSRFLDVMMAGMAPDGGLYLPESWPELDRSLFSHLSGLRYAGIAMHIIKPFVGNDVPDDVLQRLLDETYTPAFFNHTAMTPLVQAGPNAWIMELFHGPTYSFKDYALQFLGRLFDYVLGQRGQRITIVGATSGDTGSAAIEACRHCKNIDIFILHPQGRTSEVQRRQMTTVSAPNVFNIALAGTFDDCQGIVKSLFADEVFRVEYSLSAVNSINWVRIMAQIVYYAVAAVALGGGERPVSFTVPTGNFGNIYAGWVARRMGVPIKNLVVASNRNDILTRFFESGDMRPESVVPSLSPSMDIQVSSNFERYLCDLIGRDYAALVRLMESFRTQKAFHLSGEIMQKARRDFRAYRCSDLNTLEIMKQCYQATGIMIDPHTAVGFHAAQQEIDKDPATPMVMMACAHPAKFPDAVRQATGLDPVMPAALAGLQGKAEKFMALPRDLDKVRQYIRQSARRQS